ncbi:MAG TPA: histidine phosphatase family protein [Planctomycetaceae bacterium]|nr:histidine phosphatase family protein [Planctomycetaceae bacterium]
MQLLIIRHARAAEAHGHSDAQRPLTKQGRREFAAAARWVVKNASAPGHVFHSPALRATETAEILATAAGLTDHAREIAAWLTFGTGCDEIIAKLRDPPADVTALVGHEPSMSALASKLVGGGQMSFHPGTIACIEFESTPALGLGKLLWLQDAGMF